MVTDVREYSFMSLLVVAASGGASEESRISVEYVLCRLIFIVTVYRT